MMLLVSLLLAVTYDDVLESAERHSPTIIAAERDRDRASADVLAASGAFDPSLRAQAEAVPSGQYPNGVFDTWVEQPIAPFSARAIAGYRFGHGEFGPYDGKLETNSIGELRAGIEVSLLRNRRLDERRGRLAASEAALDAAGATLELTLLDIKRAAAQRYWEWVAAGERLRIARALLRLADDRQDATVKRSTAGDIAAIEATDNERLVQQRRALVLSAERALAKAANELSIFYRDAQGNPRVLAATEVPGALPEPQVLAPPTDDDFETAFTQHPELSRLSAQRRQLSIEVDLARNLGMPRLDARVLVAQDLGEGDTKRGRPELRLGLTFELPFVRRTPRGREEAALSTLSRVGENERLARDRIRMLAIDAWQTATVAIDRLATLRIEVDKARAVENGERVKALAGDSNLLLVNLREQATADAEARVVEALLDHHRARADLKAALALRDFGYP